MFNDKAGVSFWRPLISSVYENEGCCITSSCKPKCHFSVALHFITWHSFVSLWVVVRQPNLRYELWTGPFQRMSLLTRNIFYFRGSFERIPWRQLKQPHPSVCGIGENKSTEIKWKQFRMPCGRNTEGCKVAMLRGMQSCEVLHCNQWLKQAWIYRKQT